jgi:hypothetical protein
LFCGFLPPSSSASSSFFLSNKLACLGLDVTLKQQKEKALYKHIFWMTDHGNLLWELGSTVEIYEQLAQTIKNIRH